MNEIRNLDDQERFAFGKNWANFLKNLNEDRIKEAEDRGADADELRSILGSNASKRGIFEGDIENGEMEIGQAVAGIKELKPISKIVNELVEGYNQALDKLR